MRGVTGAAENRMFSRGWLNGFESAHDPFVCADFHDLLGLRWRGDRYYHSYSLKCATVKGGVIGGCNRDGDVGGAQS